MATAALAKLIRTELGLKCSRSHTRFGAWNQLATLAGYGNVEWMPRSVIEAMYGIDWARRTGRLPGEVEMRIRALSDWQLCGLVADVATECGVQGVVPHYLIQRFS